jgi:phosphoribosylglycinamide formyltransferase-1
MLALGVLISGRGSNLQAIIDAIARKELFARIAVVISNKADAFGLERAKKAGIDTMVIPSKDRQRIDFEKDMIEILDARGVELVVLAGFMRILSPFFLRKYKNRVINIHPALLPAFPGENAQEQAFNHGVKVTGCTVHIIDENVDTGPIVVQIPVECQEGDTAETLAARILEQEHRALPRAIQYFAEGRVQIDGRKVKIINRGK